MWKSSTPKRPINDLLSNIHHLMPMKLEEGSSFDVWKYQMTAIIGAYDLLGYVEGSLLCPNAFWAADEAIWCREDQAVMAAINAHSRLGYSSKSTTALHPGCYGLNCMGASGGKTYLLSDKVVKIQLCRRIQSL